MLPVAVIAFDCDMRRVYRRKEKLICILLKVVFWGLFYVLFGLAAVKKEDNIVKFGNLVLIIWPCAGICYTFLLMKFPSLSDALPSSERDQMQRFENMVNQRV